MRLFRTRFDDVRWVVFSRPSKLVSLVLLVSLVSGGVVSNWSAIEQQFFQITGITPPNVVVEKDRVAVQKTLLAGEVPELVDLVEDLEARDGFERDVKTAKSVVSVARSAISDDDVTVAMVRESRDAVRTTVEVLRKRIAEDEKRVAAELAQAAQAEAEAAKKETEEVAANSSAPSQVGGGVQPQQSPPTPAPSAPSGGVYTSSTQLGYVCSRAATITFTATSDAQISLQVSGSVSGGNSGSGSTSVTVNVPAGGSVTAVATGQGRVGLSSSGGVGCT